MVVLVLEEQCKGIVCLPDTWHQKQNVKIGKLNSIRFFFLES